MDQSKLWPLRLVFTFRFGRWCTSLVVFVCLMVTFWGFGSFDPGTDQYSIALFFSCLLAYMIPCFHYIIEKSLDAVVDLKPLMGLSEQEFDALRHSIQAKSKRLIVTSPEI